MSNGAEEEGSRPKLSLQPRGASAETTAPATSASTKPAKPSPFGAARPREQVIAEREGKNETEVLKEQAQKEWAPHIVLTEAQREEKKAAEAELAYAQNELEKETDPVKLEGLREEIGLQEKKLEDLLASFERMAVQTAQSGGTRSSQDKAPGISANTYNENPAGSRNFMNRGHGRGGERSSYGNTWGDAKGRSGQSQCYTCGEVGHFSRDCPSGGGGVGGSRGGYGGPVGGRGGGGNVCYTCGQQGHFSRECPYADNYGASQYSGQAAYYDSYQGNPNTPYGGGVYGGDQAGGYNGGYGNYRGFPSGRANYSRQGDYRSQ